MRCGGAPSDFGCWGRRVFPTQQGWNVGYVLWQGPSRLNGADVVVVATGVDTPSHNPKTGAMVQTWILLADQAPHEAVRQGADGGVCGGCALRGRQGQERACYVRVDQAPLMIWRAWQAGRYTPAFTPEAQARVGAYRAVRLGAYGDPAAVPIAIWDALLQRATGWTGYSHQWRSPRLRDVMRYCVASCETEADVADAKALGFGTFRVTTPHALPLHFEEACPSGLGVQCVACQRCNGSGRHITIPAHGRGAKWFSDHSDVYFTAQPRDFRAQTT